MIRIFTSETESFFKEKLNKKSKNEDVLKSFMGKFFEIPKTGSPKILQKLSIEFLSRHSEKARQFKTKIFGKTPSENDLLGQFFSLKKIEKHYKE